jgi:hypothetical protein
MARFFFPVTYIRPCSSAKRTFIAGAYTACASPSTAPMPPTDDASDAMSLAAVALAPLLGGCSSDPRSESGIDDALAAAAFVDSERHARERKTAFVDSRPLTSTLESRIFFI